MLSPLWRVREQRDWSDHSCLHEHLFQKKKKVFILIKNKKLLTKKNGYWSVEWKNLQYISKVLESDYFQCSLKFRILEIRVFYMGQCSHQNEVKFQYFEGLYANACICSIFQVVVSAFRGNSFMQYVTSIIQCIQSTPSFCTLEQGEPGAEWYIGEELKLLNHLDLDKEPSSQQVPSLFLHL